MKSKFCILLLLIAMPLKGICQENRLDRVANDACECIEKLDEHKLELGNLDILLEKCLVAAIVENIHLYEDVINVDSVIYLEEDVEDFVMAKKNNAIMNLLIKCERLRDLYQILRAAQLKRQVLEVNGFITAGSTESRILVKAENGSIVEFFYDKDSEGLFDIIPLERAINKKVRIQYRELKYYEAETKTYRVVNRITSMDWLDRFSVVFKGESNEKQLAEIISEENKGDSMVWGGNIFEQYQSSSRMSSFRHLKVIGKCDGSSCNYDVYYAKNLSYLSKILLEEVEYYPDPYRIQVSHTNKEIHIEELDVPKREFYSSPWIAYINRSCSFPSAGFDQKKELFRVLSYYASLKTYTRFLEAERDYLSRGSADEKKKYRQLDAVLSSQNLSYDCMASIEENISKVEEKIAQKEKEKWDESARLLDQDTIVFQYYYPFYSGSMIILDTDRSTPKKKRFTEYFKFSIEDEWLPYYKIKVKISSFADGKRYYELKYRRIRSPWKSYFYKKHYLSYTYDPTTHILSEKERSFNWYQKLYQRGDIGRKIHLAHPTERTESQILSKVATLFVSFEDWELYLTYLGAMNQLRAKYPNGIRSKEYYEYDRKVSSIAGGFQKLFLPIKLDVE